MQRHEDSRQEGAKAQACKGVGAVENEIFGCEDIIEQMGS